MKGKVEMMQKDVFLKSEGDAWFNRNKGKKRVYAVPEAIKCANLKPHKVLEIGCSGAYVLEKIRQDYKAEVYGIDPSSKAIESGKKKFPEVNLSVGCADSLDFANKYFDTVIFGFCLYIIDRELLFQVAKEADRVLQDNGYLIIEDFYVKYGYKNEYKYYKNVFSFKEDYSKIFLASPLYELRFFNCKGFDDDCIGVFILRKRRLK